MICLDTNAVIAVLNNRRSPVRTRIDAAIGLGRTFAISSIVLYELRYGAAKSARVERNTQRIADFLSGPIEVLPFETTTLMKRAISAPRWSARERPSGPTTFSSQRKRVYAMRFL